MFRRTFFKSALAAIAGLFTVRQATAAAVSVKVPKTMLRVGNSDLVVEVRNVIRWDYTGTVKFGEITGLAGTMQELYKLSGDVRQPVDLVLETHVDGVVIERVPLNGCVLISIAATYQHDLMIIAEDCTFMVSVEQPPDLIVG